MKYASGGAATCESIVHDIGSAAGAKAAGTVTSEMESGAAVAGTLGGLVGGWAGGAVADRICVSSGSSANDHSDHEGGSDKGDCEGGGSCHM